MNASAALIPANNSAVPNFRRQNSVPYLTVPAPGPLLDGNGDLMSPLDPNDTSSTVLEDDYDGECYFSRHPEEIDPNLSLGLIEWKAPKSTTAAIPTSLELTDLATPVSGVLDSIEEDSTSDYFSRTKIHDVLLSVRQTDAWPEMKDDLIFREFSTLCSRLVSFAELQARYRRRFDREWAEGNHHSVYTQDFNCSQPPSREQTPSIGDHMEIDDTRRHHAQLRNQSMEFRCGQLEHPSQARQRPMHSRAQSVTHTRSQQINHSRAQSVNPSRPQPVNHSRSNSIVSQRHGNTTSTTTKLTRPKPLPLVHDQAQEDILAALGVTGSARQVYETPGPAFGPPPPEKPNNKSHSRTGSMSSTHSNTTQSSYRFPSQRAPSLPPPQAQSHHDRWSSGVTNNAPFATPMQPRVPAAIRPDFSPITEDDFTPRPKYPAAMSASRGNGNETTRKRSYADSLLSGNGDGGSAVDARRSFDAGSDAEEREDEDLCVSASRRGGARGYDHAQGGEEEDATPKPRKQLRV
jgi:hypothetical protein